MLTPQKFIQLWQQSKSLDDIEKQTTLTRSALQSRASLYRKNGVNLKRFGRARITNWAELADFADDCLSEAIYPQQEENTEDS